MSTEGCDVVFRRMTRSGAQTPTATGWGGGFAGAGSHDKRGGALSTRRLKTKQGLLNLFLQARALHSFMTMEKIMCHLGHLEGVRAG